MAKNSIVVKGNLCADCRIGAGVVKARLAVNRGENKDPLFIGVSLFTNHEGTLDACEEELTKGAFVEVEGELVIEDYVNRNGEKCLSREIIAREINVLVCTLLPLKEKPAAGNDKKRNRPTDDEDDEDDPAPRKKSKSKSKLQSFDDEDVLF